MKVHPQKMLHPLAQMILLLVFFLERRMLQVQIKGNHMQNLRKMILQLGYSIRQQYLIMRLMKMPILLPLKCLNLIKEATMVPHLKGKYKILLMQVAIDWKALRVKERVFILLLLLD